MQRKMNKTMIVISALLIAAHFLRSGSYILIILSVLAPVLMFVESALAAGSLRIFLFLAAAEWARTGFLLVGMRRADGQPWMRLAAILGSVALFTFISALTISFRKPAAPDDKKNEN